MAYPFHRADTLPGAGHLASPSHLFKPPQFQRSPGWDSFREGYRASLIEPLEPRLLLSADFMPAAADAMGEGLEDFQDLLEDFFDTELDDRVPLLLIEDPDYDETDTDDAPFEAPRFLDLFAVAVDADGDGDINGKAFDTGDDDEDILHAWDMAGNDDGVVDAAEMLDALLFAPMEEFLTTGVDNSTEVDEFVTFLEGGLILNDGLDLLLEDLGPDFSIDFDLVSATDLTEEPDAEVVFSLQFELTIERADTALDLGLDADDLKLLAFTGDSLNPEAVTLPLESSLSFGFEFGVYTGGQDDADLNALDFFIRRADDMLFSVVDTVPDDAFNFDLNIGFLGADVVDGSIDFQADILATLVDPDSPAVLGFDSSQYGVEQTGGEVVADNAIPDFDLPHDAGFVLRLGNIGIATDVLVTADASNGDNADLVADVQAAVNAAGLGDLVTVDLTGSDELRFSLPTTNAGELGFTGFDPLSETGLLTAAGLAPANQPGDDVTFLLSLAGALPRLVTIRAPGAEQEDIGFAASEMSDSLAPLVAAGAIDAGGVIGGDAQADLTLRVAFDDGTFSDIAVATTEALSLPSPNTSSAELFADFDAALGSALFIAGKAGAVTASESAGTITLTGAADVTGIEVIAADTEASAALGFTAGQKTLLTLTADDVVADADFAGNARLIVSVNGTDHRVDFEGGHASAADLATEIDSALSDAGLAVSASVDSGRIVLSADDTSVYELSLLTDNQLLEDLIYDLNNALDLAGFDGVTDVEVSADEDTGNIRLIAAGGETLEITNTLTFDAGVRGAELDGSGSPPDASFDIAVGDNSELVLDLPVEVKDGLRDLSTAQVDDFWKPQDMAIVGNFNPLGGLLDVPPVPTIATFEPTEPDNQDPGTDPQEVNRFRLAFDITPPNGDDPLIPIPSPAADNTLQLVNFAEALQFNQIGPGSFIGMLGELGAALDSIMQNALFAGYDIPFTDATLKDIVAFEAMIKNSMIYDLGPDGMFDAEAFVDDGSAARLLLRSPVGAGVIDPEVNFNSEGAPLVPNGFHPVETYTTAQEMGARLAEILRMPLFTDTSDDVGNAVGGINPTYDPSSNELTYDMDLISSDRVSVGVDDPDTADPALDPPFTTPFEFDVDLTPFSEFLITAAGVGSVGAEDLLVTLEARTTFSATYGFDLTPSIDPDPTDDDNLLEERFFVRDATLGGAFIGTLPDDGVQATALMGIIGVDINDIDGSFGAQFSAQLKDEGGAAGSQVSLETIQQDIQDTFIGPTTGTEEFGPGEDEILGTADDVPIYAGPDQNGGQVALEIVTDPVVSKLQTLDFDDQIGPVFTDVVAGRKIVADSGGTAYVVDVSDSGSSGTLYLFGVEGTFADDDFFVDVLNVANPVQPFRGGRVDGGIETPEFFGEFDMEIEVQDGFVDTGFGGELAELDALPAGNINVNLAVFGNPNADIDPAIDATDLNDSLAAIGTDVGGTFVSLGEYAPLDYFDLVAVLEQLGDLVAELEAAYPVLTQTLPVVNKSFSDLLGLTEGVDRAVAQARALLEDQQSLLGLEGDEVPTLTLQGLASALRGAFGLEPTDGVSLVVDVETIAGTPYLTLDFDIEETVSTTLGLDIDLGASLPNLTSGKVLRADGNLGWGFKVGVALNNSTTDPDSPVDSDFKLFNPEGGLEGDLKIFGDGAEGVGLVFLAQVGDAAVQVMDALVDIELDFSLGGLDFSATDDIKTLSDVGFGDFPDLLVPVQDYDVSIPLFDIAGGLTGFLTEISASGDKLLDDVTDLLDGLPDASALADLESQISDFIDSLDEFNPLENLLLLTDAADLFFETVQELLDQATSVDLPIVGDKLADGVRFIEGFRDQFINQFRQLVEFTNDLTLEDVTQFIEDFFDDVIGLDIVNVAGQLIENAAGTLDDEIRWDISLKDNYNLDFDLGFDLGVPLLNLSSDIPIELGVEWELDIGLGVNRQDGAFIILEEDYAAGENADKGELEVRAFVDLPEGTPFKGTLGFLEVLVENNGSGMELLFGIDLENNGGADSTVLPIADIGNLGFDVMFGGGGLDQTGNGLPDPILNLELSVGVAELDVLPKLKTDFVMDWSLGEGAWDAVDNLIQEGLDLLDFGEVQIDLTSLLNGFIGDVLTGISDFLGPLQDISDLLNEDVPIISQLFGPTSLLDLAELLGLADTRLFEAIDQISDILDVVETLSGDAFITLGDLEVFNADNIPNLDFANALFDPDIDFSKAIEDTFGDFETLVGQVGDVIDDFATAVTNSPAPGTTKSSFNDTTNLSVGGASEIINLPWLDSPELLLGLLVGEDVSLITLDLPPLGVGFDYEQFVTIFGPLGASIGFGFFVGADFSAGFDTFGLNRFADSNFTNPGLIFDGFFLGDRENITEGADIEELFLEMTLTAAAELNLGVASGGVGGGITARLGLDLYDPDDDGAVHISELVNTIENELRSDPTDLFRAARSIFDLQGAILAELFWYLKILTAEFGDTIFGPEEVFTFEIPFERTPILGTEVDTDGNDDPDTLIINAGPNSVDRLNGDVSDGNESFVVEYMAGGDIGIKSDALGVSSFQVYDKGYDHIIFIGGEGNDSITFQGFDQSNITFDLQGGAGDDVIEFVENLGVTPATGAGALIRGGAGNDRLIGSHLNDEIYGELGNDIIEGGRGYDILIGDNATLRDGDGVSADKTIGARVSVLDGNDTIDGGDDDDIIIGGGGTDDIAGGDGADVILGDGGRFGYFTNSPQIDVDAFAIPDFVPNDRLNPDVPPELRTAKQMDDILLALDGIFTGTDLGLGGDDMIDGDAGEDIIFGGAGNDDISGGGDGDHVVGGRGFDVIDGDGGDDVLFGNEQDDIINGGDGSDVIAGGFGDDTLHGDADNDYMTGSRGRDVMFGDGGDDEMHGEGEPDIMFGGADDDLVIGGVGADIMMGDDGVVVKFDVDGGGTDLVIGKDTSGVVAAYEGSGALIDTNPGSLDLILTDVLGSDGNDILSGGEGGDIMLGGGGNDLGGGDVDPRSGTANTNDVTTPDGDDVLIGDGGIVEFNQRRLQRIASEFVGDPANTYRDTLYGDNGDDVIIGGRGDDGDDNGTDATLNIPSLGIGFMLTGGHGPDRGATDPDVSDDDIIIGDNGELVYIPDADPAPDATSEHFGELAFIQTTDTSNTTGGADTAFGEEGSDIILGGVNGSVDVLSGAVGEDVILGDNGLIHFYYDWANDGNVTDANYTPDDGDPDTLDLIRSYNDGLGGVDIVSGEEDSDVLIGGEAGDFVYGDNFAADSGGADGDDVMLGDNGDIFLDGEIPDNPATLGRLVQGAAIDLITTTDIAENTGGADTMAGNAGADIIIGGVNDGGIDRLYGDARTPIPDLDGDDIILGDNGLLDYTWDGANEGAGDADRETLDLIATTAQAGGGIRGGVDYIFANAGDDTAFGGSAADRIFGDNDEDNPDVGDNPVLFTPDSGTADLFGVAAGEDILFGDQGKVELVNNLVTLIESTDLTNAEGGADHIQGNDHDDIILGGVAGDELHGEAFLTPGEGVADLVQSAGDDTILGDEGRLRFDVVGDLVAITGSYTAQGDGDPVTLDFVETFATGSLGGNDLIYGNGASDIAMGGRGDDLIHGDFYLGSLVAAINPGNDKLLGDGGQQYFQNGNAIMLRTSEFGKGGVDTIHGNDLDDTVVGGAFGDMLYGETDVANQGLIGGRAGEDIMLGDNARLDWTLPDDDILGRQDVVNVYGGTSVTVDQVVVDSLLISNDPPDGWQTLDRVSTIQPTDGGNDVMYGNGNSSANHGDAMFGGTGNDNMYGDSGDANADGPDGVDGADLMFGDHGKLYPSIQAFDVQDLFTNNNFFSIDTQESDGADFDGGHNDFQDVMFGNGADDILIGGQDDDALFGGTDDDDLIGGHNVSGGHDELDAMSSEDVLAITPNELADLNPADVNDINDIMDGGEDDDVLAGDNAIIIRQATLDTDSPRFRMTEEGVLYALESDTVDNLADVDVGFRAAVTDEEQPHQDMDRVRDITLLDHTETIETDAAAAPLAPRVFGNDVMAGALQDDEMFGQLGDDVIQGDGAISLEAQIDPNNFDPYNPSQSADQSFDVRNINQRVDLMAGNDMGWTLRFNVFEDFDDGDDYIEGNGGNDRIYGNLGQDDIIGGSSILFGLDNDNPITDPNDTLDHLLRPDGADLIYGGAGNAELLSRNASFGGPDNDITGDTIVPEAERHAADADTILGDNGEIYRIVVPEGDQVEYAVFNYDRDAVVASGFEDDGFGGQGDELTIRVRAVDLGDYGYSYVGGGAGRETLEFLATAQGEGDLIYGESGDDLIHGMTGDDVIFGNSEHDDLHGEIGNDFILGGTGIDGIVGDDGFIMTSRNSDVYGESLYGIDALLPEETGLKKNESPDPRSLNAEIRTPGNIQRAIINVENELVKSVELLAFRTDDLDADSVGEFNAPIRFNDVVFGGLDSDFIHAGDGDDAVSGAEALPVYYSGAGFEVAPDAEFTEVNTFLQNMQSSPSNLPEDSVFNNVEDLLTDNPFWFDFAPYNPGDILRFEGKPILEENGQRARTRDEFAWYDEFNPRRKLMFDFEAGLAATVAGQDDVTALASLGGYDDPDDTSDDADGDPRAIDFILNFDEGEGVVDERFSDEGKESDGDDRAFGDLGNDWIVGGTGRDHMYGGRGDDLLNMDDNHDSGFTGRVKPKDPPPDPLDNKDGDEFQAYADIVYAGAGRDVMILNTGADRAIDWVGEYNSYLVPFSPFGAFHISRSLQPQIPEFLYALSESDGVDINVQATLVDTNTVDGQLYVDQKGDDVRTDAPDPLRNFEPYGELGMVRQTDYDWQAQTGAPNDPQPGNLQGKREIMRRELFNDSAAEVPLAADVGDLSLTSQGALEATPEEFGGEVVGLYPLGDQQPTYTEVLVTVNADKDRAGVKSNGYIIFDYKGPEDFKFAGVDVGTDKLQIGHRDASGWVVDTQTQVQMRANRDIDVTLVLFGSQATVYVGNKSVSLDFNEPLNDGGMFGLGTNNSVARFDDFQVQTLPPDWTFVNDTDFNSPAENPFTIKQGNWNVEGGQLNASSATPLPGLATDVVDVASYTRLEMLGTVNTSNQGGFVFDYFSKNEFKYALLDVQNDQVVIGHYLNGQWWVDATVDQNLKDGKDYSLMVTMFGSTASVTLDGQAILTHSFNSILNDGQFGVLNVLGESHFDDFLVRGDDPAYAGAPLLAPTQTTLQRAGSLSADEIADTAASAIELMDTLPDVDAAGLAELAIVVDDLPGNQLALFQGDRIVIDQDAAGHGWFVGAEAPSDGIDLLSTLLHEYGHAVGLEHDSGLAFMADELDVGERFAIDQHSVKVLDESTGELLSTHVETTDDTMSYDSVAAAGDGLPGRVVQWGSTTTFAGRHLQLR